MYVLLEYLVSLAAVCLLGLAFFAVALVGLVAKTAASRAAAITVETLPKISSHISTKHFANFKKNQNGPLVQS